MTVVLDSSALVAIVLGEPEAERLVETLVGLSGRMVVGTPTLVEAGIVVEARSGPDGVADLHALVVELEADVVAFDEMHAGEAMAAWRRFGKGRHPAKLNLGDCYAYALARLEDAELAFVGDDFSQTDVRTMR